MFSYPNKVDLYFDRSNSDNFDIIKKCPHLYQGAGEFDMKERELPKDPTVKDNKAVFQPPVSLYATHIMNYYATFMKKKLNLKIKREEIVAPDGGSISLDWFEFPGSEFKDDTPTIFILHGLTGGSHEIYIQYFAKYAYETQGYRSVVLNYRGCAGNLITADIGYCAVQIDDAKYVVNNHVLPKCKGAPMFAIGFSLGSSILVNYLADQGEKSPFLAHCSISNPIDMEACTRNLKATYLNNKFYNELLCKNLKRLFKRFGTRLDKYATNEQIQAAKTIYDLDTLITSKMFGYKSAEDYYRNAGSLRHIDTLKKPILFINALDDPISPGYSLPYDKFKFNPNVMLATTPSGGHLGFISNIDWESWSDKVAVEYFNTFLSKTNSK